MFHFFRILLFLFLVGNIQAQVVQEVKLVNLVRLDGDPRIEVLKDFKGKDLEAQVTPNLPDTINQLYATGKFSSIDVSFEKGVLLFNFVESPIILRVAVTKEGDTGLEVSEILPLVSRHAFAGISLKEGVIKRMQEELIAFYRTQGYYNARINVGTTVLPENQVELFVKINAGLLSRVSKIFLNGVEAFSKFSIERLFVFEEKGFISQLTDSDVFSVEKLKGSLSAIRSFYLNQGYLDFKINSYDWVMDPSSKNFIVYVNVDEGKLYTVDSVEFLNTLKRYKNKFEPLMSLKKGDVYKNNQLLFAINNMQQFYQNLGFSYGQVDYQVTRDASNQTVKVFLSLSSNVLAYVNRINFTGNSKTYDSVLRRQLNFSEGELFSKTKLDVSVGKLKSLGFFENVDYKIRSVGGSKSLVDININTQEIQKPGNWSLSSTKSQLYGWLYNVRFKDSNFLGSGDSIHVLLQQGADGKTSNLVGQYTDRNVANQSANLTSRGSFSFREEKGVNTKQYDLYFAYAAQLNASNNHKLTPSIKVSDIHITCTAKFKAEEEQCSIDQSRLYQLKLSYNMNTISQQIFPLSGGSGNLGFGVVFGDNYEYQTAELDFKYYIPIGPFTAKIRGSVEANFAENNGKIPFFNRFLLSKNSNIRGFTASKFADRYTSVNRSKGGNLITLFGTELVYNPRELTGINGMRVGAFLDAGYIFKQTSDFKTDDIRASVGAVAYWASPFGFVSVFKAWSFLDKEQDTFNGDISFSLGGRF